MISPDKIINDLRITLELIIAAHPTISYNYNLNTLALFKRKESLIGFSYDNSELRFSFTQNYIRILTTRSDITYNIDKIPYDEINLEQLLTKIIAEWI